jgi:hypothetical protein
MGRQGSWLDSHVTLCSVDCSRWNRATSVGVTLRGAQPVRRDPAPLSQPDSSKKTKCSGENLEMLYRYESRRLAFRPFATLRIFFLVQPIEASALPILDVVTGTSNSFCRKSFISYWYDPGLFWKYSRRASSRRGNASLPSTTVRVLHRPGGLILCVGLWQDCKAQL